MKKKLIIGAVLTASVCLYVHAAIYNVQSFSTLNQTTPLKNVADIGWLLPNNATVTNGQTNLTFYVYGNNYPQFVSASQALYAYATNQIGIQSGGTIGGTGYTNITPLNTNLSLINPYGYALSGTNSYYIIGTNGYSTTAGSLTSVSPWNSVTLFADANGDFQQNAGFTFAANSDNNLEVGNMTINLAKSYDGLSYDSNNLQAITLALRGTNVSVTNVFFPLVTTNTTAFVGAGGQTNNAVVTSSITSSWLLGAHYIRIYSIVTPTNSPASTNTYLYVGNYGGWVP